VDVDRSTSAGRSLVWGGREVGLPDIRRPFEETLDGTQQKQASPLSHEDSTALEETPRAEEAGGEERAKRQAEEVAARVRL
jgi:hypothetical protein